MAMAVDEFLAWKNFWALAVRFWWVFWIGSEVIFSELYSLMRA
jgi:hypothetical protein